MWQLTENAPGRGDRHPFFISFQALYNLQNTISYSVYQQPQGHLHLIFLSKTTGWFLMIKIKYELIAQTKKHRWSIRQVGKFHWVWYILIFHGHNQYKSFSKLLFHLASISLKNRNIWKIHTKSFEILCKKSVLLSFLVILSLVLKIEHS